MVVVAGLVVVVVDVVVVERRDVEDAGAGAFAGLGGFTGGAFAIGRDSPRSFPRLATPTPHVSCVL